MTQYRLQYNGNNESAGIFDVDNKNVLLDLHLSKLCIILDKDSGGYIKIFGLDEDEAPKVIQLNSINALISIKESL